MTILFCQNSDLNAQKSRVSFSTGCNWGYNAGLVSNGRNSGTGLGWNMRQDAMYNLFKTIDYNFGINYHLKNENILSIEYRKYHLRQVYSSAVNFITLDVIHPLNSAGVFIKHNWNNSGMKTGEGKKRKISIFTKHGVNFIFDSKKERIEFKSKWDPKTAISSFDRIQNFKSFSIINYIISNSFGINHAINDNFSIDYYADFNLGIRNLYTNLILFKNEYPDYPGIYGYEESFTGMNKGDKLGIGIKINYRLNKKKD